MEGNVKQKNQEQTKVRVCQISTGHSPFDGRVFARTCCSLAKAGYDVHYVVQCEQSQRINDVEIHAITRATNRFTRMIILPWIAVRTALKTKAEIYHYHDAELIPVGFVLKWFLGKKVIFDIHESYAEAIKTRSWIPRLLRNPISWLYKAVEKILTLGQVIVLANEGSAVNYPSSAYVVRNFPLSSEEFLSKSGANRFYSEVPLLVYVGAFSMIRGAEVYVELAGGLARDGYQFRMMIIGTDTDGCVKKLQPRIKELNVEDKVSFAGQMEYSKAMEFVSQAAIGFCLFLPVPHNISSLSQKILEYMRTGTPVLASDFEGYRYFVEKEKAGIVVDPTDFEEVISVCEKMLSNRDELAEMGKRGMEAVRTKYSWSSEFKILLQCYEDLRAK